MSCLALVDWVVVRQRHNNQSPQCDYGKATCFGTHLVTHSGAAATDYVCGEVTCVGVQPVTYLGDTVTSFMCAAATWSSLRAVTCSSAHLRIYILTCTGGADT